MPRQVKVYSKSQEALPDYSREEMFDLIARVNRSSDLVCVRITTWQRKSQRAELDRLVSDMAKRGADSSILEKRGLLAVYRAMPRKKAIRLGLLKKGELDW